MCVLVVWCAMCQDGNLFFVLHTNFVIQNSGLDTKMRQNFAQIILSSNIILLRQ